MSEFLIQSETLDEIADAINAKTGGSSAMTPAEMVTEIGSIQTGGGAEKVYTKLGEATITEPVNSIYITMTEQMKSCECLYLVLDSIALSEADWLYLTMNGGVGGIYTPKITSLSDTVAFAPIKKPTAFARRTAVASATKLTYGGSSSWVISNLTSIGVKPYSSTITITSGKIEVWGYV